MPVTVNVGLSRKLSQDFNSRGFSLNVEAELPSNVIDNPDVMADSVGHLFRLAEDLLDEQIRAASEPGVAQPTGPNGLRPKPANGPDRGGNGSARPKQLVARSQPASRADGDGPTRQERGVTDAQLRAMTRMTARLEVDLDAWSEQEFGVPASNLTIRQASTLIDLMKQEISQRTPQEAA